MTKRDISNSRDTTLETNTIKYWEFLITEYLLIKDKKLIITEYLLIKDKKHNRFCCVQEFYNFYHIKRQNFIKYYNRYKLSKLNNCSLKEINESLLPNKRGPKYIHNRTKVSEEIINKIKKLRINNVMNRYNIKKKLRINKINELIMV